MGKCGTTHWTVRLYEASIYLLFPIIAFFWSVGYVYTYHNASLFSLVASFVSAGSESLGRSASWLSAHTATVVQSGVGASVTLTSSLKALYMSSSQGLFTRTWNDGNRLQADLASNQLPTQDLTAKAEMANFNEKLYGSEKFPDASLMNYGGERIPFWIVGGHTADRDRYPFLVNLFNQDSFPIRPFCGGTLVAPNIVLTAAHCVARFSGETGRREVHVPDYITIGKYDLSDREEAVELFTVRSVEVHPGFDLTRRVNDFALVELAGKSQYEPVILADDNFNTKLLRLVEGKSILQVTAVGWGAQTGNFWPFPTPVLMEADLSLIGHHECKSLWLQYVKEVASEATVDFVFDEDQVVCAYGEGKRSACFGDSGGPLLIRKEVLRQALGIEKIDSDLQIGVVSYGPGNCAHSYVPGVYMNANHARDWIQGVIRDNHNDPTSKPYKLRTMSDHLKAMSSSGGGQLRVPGVLVGFFGVAVMVGVLSLTNSLPRFSVIKDKVGDELSTGRFKGVSQRFSRLGRYATALRSKVARKFQSTRQLNTGASTTAAKPALTRKYGEDDVAAGEKEGELAPPAEEEIEENLEQRETKQAKQIKEFETI